MGCSIVFCGEKMRLAVFFRGMKTSDLELAKKVLGAAKIDEFRTYDLSVEDLEKTPPNENVGVAFGKIATRKASGFVNHLFEMPTTSQLQKKKGNELHRKQAWEIVQRVALILGGKQEEQLGASGDWRYAMLPLGTKNVCVYEGKKPVTVEADVYISKPELDLLLKAKEAFRADAVLIQDK